MSVPHRILYFLNLACTGFCILVANDPNIVHCAKQRTIHFEILSFDAETDKCDTAEGNEECDFWFYSTIIGADDYGAELFFANGNNNNRFDHANGQKPNSFTWEYDEDKTYPTLVILMMEDDGPNDRRDHETMRKVMRKYVEDKPTKYPDNTAGVTIECFWMKQYPLKFKKYENVTWSDKLGNDHSNCIKSRHSAENIDISLNFSVHITSKEECPTVAQSTSTATATRTSVPTTLLTSSPYDAVDSVSNTTTSPFGVSTDEANEVTEETKDMTPETTPKDAEDECNLWVLFAAVVTLSILLIVIVLLLLLWYKKQILAWSSPLPKQHQHSKIPQASEQQQLESVTLRSLNVAGKPKTMGHLESSRTVQSKNVSETTLNIRPDSATIRPISSRIQKPNHMEASSRSYRGIESNAEIIPINAKAFEGRVQCMNPNDTDYGPPKDVGADVKVGKV